MTAPPGTLPPSRLLQPTTVRWFAAIFGGSLVYAIVRYHFLGDVPWRHFPLFILNKTVSLAAVLFVACSYLVGHLFRWHDDDKALRLVVIKFCGLMGFFLAVAHILFSFILMTPAYFAKYFGDDGRLNVEGEVGMATGAIALLFLLAPALTTMPMMPKSLGGWRWKRSQRLGYVALGLVGAHLVALGVRGWLAPSGWHGGLPPISLVAVVAAVIPLVVKRRRVVEKQQRDAERA
jgi:DMSO/TMAO reductase YedYZ heme-binding membrane subunit